MCLSKHFKDNISIINSSCISKLLYFPQSVFLFIGTIRSFTSRVSVAVSCMLYKTQWVREPECVFRNKCKMLHKTLILKVKYFHIFW